MTLSGLSRGEVELLVDGLSDDVAFHWVLVHLGIRRNPPTTPGPPSAIEVDAAFQTIERLVDLGLIAAGRLEPDDGGPSGRPTPVHHVSEPLPVIRSRVDAALAAGTDWEWTCWLVNTDAGDIVARQAIQASE